jgi:hypothetical protein
MNIYGTYSQQENRRREEERKRAPQQCPHCGTPINQNLGAWDKPRQHCGADKCRQALSRANRAERKRREREDTRARIFAYCEQHLTRDQKQTAMNMCDLLMQFSYDEGHQIAEAVIEVIEAQRCKHDRIKQLEDNAVLWQRRAQASERQLKERIAELETELELFTTLQNTIHGIAAQQLRQQPDPQEPKTLAEPEAEPEDADRAHTLAVLAQAGIKPISQMSRAELEARAEGEEFEEGEDDEE